MLKTFRQHPRFSDAKRYFDRVRELPEIARMMRTSNSRKAFRLVLDAKKLSAQRKLPAAKELYFQAIELAPDYFRAHSFLAMIHHRLREYDDAFIHWKRAIELKPYDLGTNLGYAESLVATGDLSSGIHHIDELLAVFPKRPEIWARRACFTEEKDDFPRALDFWRTASRLAPNNPEFAIRLARVLVKLDDNKAAKELLERVKILRPDHLETQIEIGNNFLLLGYTQDAVDHFSPLLRSHPSEIPVLQGLTNSVHANEKLEKIIDWWSKYLDWNQLRTRYQASPERLRPQKPTRTKTRILFVSYSNWNFMKHIVEGFAEDQTFEVRTLDFGREILTALELLEADPTQTRARLREHGQEFGWQVDLLEWADVVFCEWATHSIIWLTRVLAPDTQLIARLHSYEAFGPWPLMTDWSRVDDLIFVADHVREYLDDAIDLSSFKNLRMHTVTPAHDVDEFDKAKQVDAPKTLGMMGYSDENKNPAFALRILIELRMHDPEWKIRFLGHYWNQENLSHSERIYYEEFKALIAEHNLSEHIIYDEWTYNVADWYPKIGYIVSTSTREGTHEAVAQGMSSGAQAIVRRWPLFARWKGAERRYPNAVLCDTPQEAADKVMAQHSTLDAEKRQLIRSEAKNRFAPDVVVQKIKTIIKDEG